MMKRLNRWDGLATVALAAIAAPYVGYLINGSMPFVHDPRGMSGVGLILGVVAFLALDVGGSMGTIERTLAGGSLALGIVALALAETFAAEVLVAVFMGTILLVWAVEIGEHIGWIHKPIQHPATRN